MKRLFIPTVLAFTAVAGLAFLAYSAPKAKAVEATPLSVTTPSSPATVAPVSQSSSPDVAASGLAITNTNGVLSGTFTMTNTTGSIVTGVNYEILLLSEAPVIPVGKMIVDSPIVFERVLQSKGITLNPKEAKKETVSYKLPPVDKGDYRIRVSLLSANGRGYGWDTVNFTNNNVGTGAFPFLATKSVNVKSTDPVSGVEAGTWRANDGVNVEPGQEFSITLNENNTSKTGISGKLVLTTKKDLTTNPTTKTVDLGISTFEAKSDNDFNLPIVAEKTPGSYLNTIALYDENNEKISMEAQFRYVVKGPSASITNVTLDNYKDGVAEISFGVAGSTDRTSVIDGTVTASIIKDGTTCSTTSNPIKLDINESTSGKVKMATGPCAPAEKPTLNLKVQSKDGTVLDDYSITLPPLAKLATKINTTPVTPPANPGQSTALIVLAVLAILLLAVIGFYFYYKKNKAGTIGTIGTLLLMLAIVSLMGARQSSASGTDPVPTPTPALFKLDASWYGFGGTSTTSDAWNVVINRPIHDSTQAYGSVSYEAAVTWTVCANNEYHMNHEVYFKNTGGKKIIEDLPAERTYTQNVTGWVDVENMNLPAAEWTAVGNQNLGSGGAFYHEWYDSFSRTYVATIPMAGPYVSNDNTLVSRNIYKVGALTNRYQLYNIVRLITWVNFTPPTHPVTCTITPQTPPVTGTVVGSPISLTAIGGNPVLPDSEYRWADIDPILANRGTFTETLGGTTTYTPNSPGTKQIRVWRGTQVSVTPCSFTVTQPAPVPIALSCTTSPSSLVVGTTTPATLSAIGGTPAKKYRWFSDNLSDTFSSAVGATTTLLPKRQPGT
ncbi:MAG: hypothetical protein Q7S57_03365, partial [bacterium]|nr:hypothetical protein [bacterium]